MRFHAFLFSFRNNRFMVERILHFGGTIENLSRFVPMLCVKLAEESAYVLGYSLL